MEIAKGVEMLHLEFQEYIIHPILLWDDEMAVLIDTGFPGQIEDIRVEMGKVGVSFDKLKAVILTHQDIDHIGSLPELLQNCGSNIKVYAHDLDKPYIEGELPLLKDAQVRILQKEKWMILWLTAKNFHIAVVFLLFIPQGTLLVILVYI